MTDPSLHTLQLQGCVARWQGGDRAAADELLRAAASRLERLAHRMLRGFPAVRGVAETGDVLQGACLRLLNALRRVQPGSTREFFALSGLQIRRELLRLAGSLACRKAAGLEQVQDVPDGRTTVPEDLELWSRFHQAVEELPAEEREVVSLVIYHGWTQAQVAELLGVSQRSVRRYWVAASTRLRTRMNGQFPLLGD